MRQIPPGHFLVTGWQEIFTGSFVYFVCFVVPASESGVNGMADEIRRHGHPSPFQKGTTRRIIAFVQGINPGLHAALHGFREGG